MMRYEFVLSGEHSEPVEGADEIGRLFDVMVDELRSRGYLGGKDLDFDAELTEPTIIETVETVETVETTTSDAIPADASVALDAPEEPTMLDRINEIRAAAANASVSQSELARLLSVSRYQIRKALS